jgi:hypothetical protein
MTIMMLDLSPHARATHWCAAYVGRLWSEAFTCWGLWGTVQRDEFGRAVPAFEPGLAEPDRAGELLQAVGATAWRPAAGDGAIARGRDGDTLLMRGSGGPHIGVLVQRPGHRVAVLHNVGGQRDDGSTWGSVRLDPVDELGRLGYGHLRLWRYGA